MINGNMYFQTTDKEINILRKLKSGESLQFLLFVLWDVIEGFPFLYEPDLIHQNFDQVC